MGVGHGLHKNGRTMPVYGSWVGGRKPAWRACDLLDARRGLSAGCFFSPGRTRTNGEDKDDGGSGV